MTVGKEEDRPAARVTNPAHDAGICRRVVRIASEVLRQAPLDKLSGEALESGALVAGHLEARTELTTLVREVCRAAGARASDPCCDRVPLEMSSEGDQISTGNFEIGLQSGRALRQLRNC